MSFLSVTRLLAAGYAVPLAESFESGWANGAAVTTDARWSATAGGLSCITNLAYVYNYTNFPTSLPLATSHTNLLRFDTQGGVLSNSFTGGRMGTCTNLYVDFMVRFVNQCDTAPVNLDPLDKCGVYVNASSQLVVYHGQVDGSGRLTNTVMEAIPGRTINTVDWHRVSITFVPVVALNGATQEAFQVRIDGVVVTNSLNDAYNQGWQTTWAGSQGTMPATSATGTWFVSAASNKTSSLSVMSFMGAGDLDDVQVVTNNPLGNVITITAGLQSTTYGTALTLGTTNFTVTGALLAGENITSVILSANGGINITDPAGLYTITPSAATGSGGFQAACYNIIYSNATLTVGAAALAIRANDESKPYGDTRTFGAGRTNFTSVGLQNGETIATVTIAAGGGTSSSDPVGTYILTPSAATGTFAPANYTIVYTNGTLTVTPRPVSLTGTRNYNGMSTALASILTVDNTNGTDVVTVDSGSATLAGAAVGAQAITDASVLVLGGTAAANYTVAGATGTVMITAGTVNLTIIATGSGTASLAGTTQVALGTTTSIVYTAESWVSGHGFHVISALTSNGVPVPAAAGQQVYIQTLSNIQAAISNNVTFTSTPFLSVAGELTVAQGQTLTLAAGETLHVAGRLIIEGTAAVQSGGTLDCGQLTIALGASLTVTNGHLIVGGSTVYGTFTLQDSTGGLIITDDYTVDGGTNSWNNSHVVVSNATKHVAIQAINGAVFNITDGTVIEKAPGTSNFAFRIQNGCVFTMVNSTLTGCGYEGSTTNAGLYIDTPNVAMMADTLANNYIGVVFGPHAVGDAINFSSIAGNTYGVTNACKTAIDATHNWWGATSGPSGVGTGTGDKVSANVTYAPYLSQPTTLSLSAGAYTPGAEVTVLGSFQFDTNLVLGSLVYDFNLPQGWTVTNVAGVNGCPTPVLDTTQYGDPQNPVLTYLSSALTSSPLQFALTLVAPAHASGAQALTSQAWYWPKSEVNPTWMLGAQNPLVLYQQVTNVAITTTDLGTYDGTAHAATATTAPAGLAVAFTYNGSSTAPASAGDYSVVATVVDANWGGSVTQSCTIGRRTLTVTATGSNRVYNATTNADVTLSSDKLAADDVSLTKTAAYFADQNVGTGKVVNVSGISTSGGTAADNYTLGNTTASTTANITPATLTVTATALNKIYDVNTSALISVTETNGVYAGDSVQVATLVGTFASFAIGTGISVTPALTLTGAQAGNYSLTQPTGLKADIIPGVATIAFFDTATTYNGVAHAVTNTTDPAGLTVAITYDGHSWAPTNAGSYAVTGVVVDAIYHGTNATTLVIAAKALTVTATGSNRVYNATTNADVTLSSDKLAADDVSLTKTAAYFADQNVGTGKVVNVSGISTSGGTAADNYTLGNTTASTTANITPATLTVTATALNKIYDVNTSALISVTETNGVYAGDSVQVATLVGTFASFAIGTGISVTPALTLTGAQAGNYSLTQPTGLKADIIPGVATIAFFDTATTYNGVAHAVTNTTDPAGLTVAITYDGHSWAPTNAGSYAVTGVVVDAIYHGTNATTLVIAAKALTITATGRSRLYGSTLALGAGCTEFTTDGTTVAGEAVTTVTLTSTDNQAGTANAAVGEYTMNIVASAALGSGGFLAANYNISYLAGRLAVDQLPVVLAGSRTYDGTALATNLILTVTNTNGTDVVTVNSGSATLASADVGARSFSSMGTLVLGGAAAANYTLTGGSGSVTITAKAL
ncbi:MAG: YDG domain-containing protein, partial [bacterium]